jgi:hypothetical protein
MTAPRAGVPGMTFRGTPPPQEGPVCDTEASKRPCRAPAASVLWRGRVAAVLDLPIEDLQPDTDTDADADTGGGLVQRPVTSDQRRPGGGTGLRDQGFRIRAGRQAHSS